MLEKIKNLVSQKEKKILFVGIGNALLSDDRVGIYLVENIKPNNNIQTLIVESGIEKFVGNINKLAPDILVLVDCTDFNQTAGFFDLIPVEEVQDNTINTHTVSLNRISEFFKMETFLLGIQPGNVKFGENISESLLGISEDIVKIINKRK